MNQPRWSWPSFRPLRTIKSRLRSVFATSVGVVLTVGFTATLVMGMVQNTVDNFLTYELPRLQQTMSLNFVVEDIESVILKLSQDTTRSALHQTYDAVEAYLLVLEETANSLSQGRVNPDVIQIQFLSQKVRSEAQLSFQLKAGALALEADRQKRQGKVLEDIQALQFLTLAALTVPSTRANPFTQIQYLTMLQATQALEQGLTVLDSANRAEQVDAHQIQLNRAVTDLQRIMNQSVGDPGKADVALLQNIVAVDWSTLLALRTRQLNLVTTGSEILLGLNRTTATLTQVSTDYSQRIEAKFNADLAFVNRLERTASTLIVVISMMAIAVIAVVQRKIIGRGFSHRLAIISQGLARVPSTPAETRVPVSGEDEIGLMARRLETLLSKALAIQTLATVDELTQVANRRYFFQQTHREIQQIKLTQKDASLLMLDIDFFKQINDSYGHDIGDQVLQAVAEICQNSLRATDIFARLGGEEFVIYCPETPLAGGQLVAERIRNSLEQTTMGPFNGISVNATISIGVTDLTPQHCDLKTALTIADQALYKAKQEGRNRVMVRSRMNESTSSLMID